MKGQQLLLPDEPQQSAGAESPKVASGLLQYIEYEPIGLDSLVVLSKMAVSDIQAQLMLLEMEGEIVALSAGRWQRV